MELFYKAFVILLPIALALGGLVSLFAVGALFYALDNPAEFKAGIETAFRGTPVAPRPLSAAHYYQPYWRS